MSRDVSTQTNGLTRKSALQQKARDEVNRVMQNIVNKHLGGPHVYAEELKGIGYNELDVVLDELTDI